MWRWILSVLTPVLKPETSHTQRFSPAEQRLDQNLFLAFTRDAFHRENILEILNARGEEGEDTKRLNTHLIKRYLEQYGQQEGHTLFEHKRIYNYLHSLRYQLAKDGYIKFNKHRRVWIYKCFEARALTHKEARYLSAQGLGQGWLNIPNKFEAIRWLHKELTDKEFEQFCCALLKYCGVTDAVVTPKRAFSGADGGIDGTGFYKLEKTVVPIVFEAKKIALSAYVGTDICQKLVGAMMEHNVNHGFMITTGLMSERARDTIRRIEKHHDVQIECIDSERMADIMLCTKDAAHGFGLHQTEIGLVYMNPKILKDSIRINSL